LIDADLGGLLSVVIDPGVTQSLMAVMRATLCTLSLVL
jgi:hypothetical protein